METWSQEAPRAEDTSTWKPTLIGPPAALPLLPMFPGSSDGRGCATLSSALVPTWGFVKFKDGSSPTWPGLTLWFEHSWASLAPRFLGVQWELTISKATSV